MQNHVPLQNDDPTRPNEAYFADVDWVVRRANQLGLTMGMLPTWGDKWNKKWGAGPEIFTPENARSYGTWLGNRYRDAAIVWILGGDRPIETDAQRAIIEALAAGLGQSSKHLKTFHPSGGQTSATWFHQAPWLDFNMMQTGHARNSANYQKIAEDYARTPAKPVLDGEPGYEAHPAGFRMENGYLDDYDNRKSLYWALLSGAAGHTYGCHAVWQMYGAKHAAINHPRLPWRDSLELPGARQMHLARQILGPSWGHLVPDSSLIVAQPAQDGKALEHAHLAAVREANGARAYIYCPLDAQFEVNTADLPDVRLRASWIDPRTGAVTPIEEFGRGAKRTFQAPGGGPDWLLQLEAV